MNFLIVLYGNDKGCAVTPTVSREFSFRKGEVTSVDMWAIQNQGFDGFLYIHHPAHINIAQIASGMKNSVQVELPYPWSKHELFSNVPIETYCKKGYFESLLHL